MTGSDTIAAVSTAPGEGGIGIVRVSGDRAAEILGKIFVSPAREGRGRTRPGGNIFANKTMYYGHIIEPSSAETVDEVLVVLMQGPHSYTGEDVCEIQCHGGGMPLRRILDIVCGLGAVPAQPGEFTKRAFLNGRIDLVQAGAVIDLIRSKTARGYHAAKEQAEGRLSERVRAVREALLGVLAEIAVRIDYPEAFEEDGEGDIHLHGDNDIDKNKGMTLNETLTRASADIQALISGAEAGRLVRDGARAVIIGKPNTGKSSLFNALAREDAAIVTATPGTTRDALEIWLDIKGVPVLMTDTAGIRESLDDIEVLGIERAREQYRKADMAIFLLDGSEPLSEEDWTIARDLDPEKKLIIAVNKADLPQAFGLEEVKGLLPFPVKEKNVVQISLKSDGSCKNGLYDGDPDGSEPKGDAMYDGRACGSEGGAAVIEFCLEQFVFDGVASGASLLVTKARHKALLETAEAEIAEANRALLDGAQTEFAEVNVRAAWNALGEMIGEAVADDVIDRVFEEFCVGK